MLTSEDHVRGDPDAPLLLVMYGDFECPFCLAAQSILERVRTRMGDELRFAFRHFPLAEVHPRAGVAAQAAEAAATAGRFWPMHDALYGLRGRLADRDLLAAAASAGVPTDDVRDALAQGLFAERVQRDLEGGRALGVASTPTFFANGHQVSGAFDARSLIDALRA